MDETRRLIVDQIPHLRRYARALLGDPDAADDLVQDGLEPAHDGLHAAPPEQDAGPGLRDLGRALAQLSEDQRQAVLLVGLEGLAYAEAAEVLDVPLGTVMSRLNRGRQRLRELMGADAAPAIRRIK